MTERELRDEVETLSGEVRDLRRQKEALAEKSTDELLAPLRARLNTARAQKDALLAQIAALRGQVRALEEEQDALKGRLSDARSEIARRTPPDPPPVVPPDQETPPAVLVVSVALFLILSLITRCA
jgi:chaperonin cofactor prefoldin